MPGHVIDLVADNANLREALAGAESAGLRSELVTQELQHRIGNLLAVVQAMARQTFSRSDPARMEEFGARLNALGMAQAILIASETRVATLADVVASALAPHGADGNRIRVSGPVIALEGRRAHALTLALHELATNATKYGALSIESGWIEISWTSVADHLAFVWREHDGPPCVAPERTGFGSFLIGRNLGAAFAGNVEIEFDSAGLICRLQAPVTQATVTQATVRLNGGVYDKPHQHTHRDFRSSLHAGRNRGATSGGQLQGGDGGRDDG